MTDDSERAMLERLRAREREYRRQIDEAHQQAAQLLADTATAIDQLRTEAPSGTSP